MIDGFFRVPVIKLKQPDLTWRPEMWIVQAGLLFAFWLITSGIVYDMINEPPAVGATDGPGGRKVPQGVMDRMNGQYFIEGLTGGFYYTMGATGTVLGHHSLNAPWTLKKRCLALGVGLALIVLAKVGTSMFWSIKMPGYRPTIF
eukprot:TRINITY_DN39215_c0_g1_i1.p1 TRINITY_DN39215_c0_g1~~TRINITY_DN39215_c0_g1_i1.p1  ORF type:complete len:162 (+),score=19.84 TRINITY_DN39215_c0_g1_i1:52-486(+)